MSRGERRSKTNVPRMGQGESNSPEMHRRIPGLWTYFVFKPQTQITFYIPTYCRIKGLRWGISIKLEVLLGTKTEGKQSVEMKVFAEEGDEENDKNPEGLCGIGFELGPLDRKDYVLSEPRTLSFFPHQQQRRQIHVKAGV